MDFCSIFCLVLVCHESRHVGEAHRSLLTWFEQFHVVQQGNLESFEHGFFPFRSCDIVLFVLFAVGLNMPLLSDFKHVGDGVDDVSVQSSCSTYTMTKHGKQGIRLCISLNHHHEQRIK